jgi:hypothetical protein
MPRTLLVLLCWAPLALWTSAAAAQCVDTPYVRSYSQAAAGVPATDGPFIGHPAVSGLSRGTAQTGYNASAVSSLSIDVGYFLAITDVGGEMQIGAQASNDASARITGDVYDCLVMGGYQGSGQLHVPIRLSGVVSVSWTIGGNYQPSPGARFAEVGFTFLCLPSVGIQGVACDDPALTFDADQGLDTTVELAFPFTFGAPIEFHFGPRMTAGVGYAANGSEGQLSGTADVHMRGVLQPAYVTDLGGGALPDATISADSGFDYLHPVPEPGAAGAAAAALAALAARLVTASRS